MSENTSGMHILEIEITDKCNLNCPHCYVDRSNSKMLLPEKVYELIDDAVREDVTRLVFTGGEPLLCPDLFDYANYARNKGIKTLFLMTNGLLLNEKNIQKCKVFDEVQISLDELPGDKASIRINYLNKLEDKFELLRQSDIFFLLFVTLNKNNVHNVSGFVEYAKQQRAHISFNSLIPLDPSLKPLALEKTQVRDALKDIVTLQEDSAHVSCNHHFRFLVDDKKRDALLKQEKNRIIGGCLAGIAAAYITVNGDVYSCPFLPVSAGNVFEEPLFKIWEDSSLLNQLRNRWQFDGACGKCNFVHICGGCRAASYLNSQNLSGSDPQCIKGVTNVS